MGSRVLWATNSIAAECLGCGWSPPGTDPGDEAFMGTDDARRFERACRRHARSTGHTVHVEKTVEGYYEGSGDAGDE